MYIVLKYQHAMHVLPLTAAPPLSSAGYLLTVASPVDGMCSEGCGCDSTTYSPVCDVSTGLTHFACQLHQTHRGICCEVM